MNTANNREQLQRWRDKILHGVAEHVCRPCSDPIKKNAELDYDNPLNCGCHCERVEKILSRAADIDADIAKL